MEGKREDVSLLSLFFELGDEASADTIEAGQESAPEMLVAPEILAGFGVEDSEVSIARRRDLVVVRDGVFGDVAVIVDRAGLSTGEEDVAPLYGSAERRKTRSACLGSETSWNFFHFLSWVRACSPTEAEPVWLRKQTVLALRMRAD